MCLVWLKADSSFLFPVPRNPTCSSLPFPLKGPRVVRSYHKWLKVIHNSVLLKTCGILGFKSQRLSGLVRLPASKANANMGKNVTFWPLPQECNLGPVEVMRAVLHTLSRGIGLYQGRLCPRRHSTLMAAAAAAEAGGQRLGH